MKELFARFCMWREMRAREAEAKWANRRYAMSPEWRRRARGC